MNSKDKTLINSARQGKRELFKQFYISKRVKFIRWAQKQFQLSESDSSELYQESMAKLYENIMSQQLQIKSNLESYLYGLAKNIMLGNFRKIAIQQKHQNRLMEHWQSHYDSENSEIVNKMKNLVTQTLPKMKTGCQQILKWFYFENRSLENIVSISDYKNKNVVKAQKSRCLQYLENELKPVITQTNI